MILLIKLIFISAILSDYISLNLYYNEDITYDYFNKIDIHFSYTL